jgi:hypothetical protein
MGGMGRKGGTGRTVRTVTVKRLLAAGVAALTTISGSAAAQSPAPKKVEIVSVTGCLREQGAGDWMVVSRDRPDRAMPTRRSERDLPTTPVTGAT